MLSGLLFRLVLLLTLVLGPLATAIAADGWSARFVLEERWQAEPAAAEVRRELQELVVELEQRIDVLGSDLESASASERQVLLQDLAAFRSQRLRALRRQGGDVLLGRWQLHVTAQAQADGGDQAMLKAIGDEITLIVDRRRQTMSRWTAEGRERSDPPDRPDLLPVSQTAAGTHFGATSHEHLLTIDGVEYRFEVVQDWPNPFAIGLRFDHVADEITEAIARLPGLPVRVVGVHPDGRHVWQVVDLERGPLPAEAFAAPDDAVR